jgi:hypothetical protein
MTRPTILLLLSAFVVMVTGLSSRCQAPKGGVHWQTQTGHLEVDMGIHRQDGNRISLLKGSRLKNSHPPELYFHPSLFPPTTTIFLSTQFRHSTHSPPLSPKSVRLVRVSKEWQIKFGDWLLPLNSECFIIPLRTFGPETEKETANLRKLHNKKTPGLSPPANYTDRATAACRRS